MEISPDKSDDKQPKWLPKRDKIKNYRLEAVENFQYLGAIISNEGSKPEVLSRNAHTTSALSRLKIIWRDKNSSITSKVKLMRTLIFSTFLYACESWTLTAELKRRIQALETRRYKKSKKISNDQELIQSDPISCPQNQKGNN